MTFSWLFNIARRQKHPRKKQRQLQPRLQRPQQRHPRRNLRLLRLPHRRQKHPRKNPRQLQPLLQRQLGYSFW
eukprot:g31272.t1